MTDAVYRIVEHDGGWAYALGDVFSETFRTKALAQSAAAQAASAQRLPGPDEAIEWQDEAGQWHEEFERGENRPDAVVETSRGPHPTRRGGASPIAALLLAGAVGVLLATLSARQRRLT